MDFDLSDEQQAIVDLVRRILDDRVTPDRLRDLEADPEWFDRETWNELARSGVIGASLPTSCGGGGLGFVETCLVLEEIGSHVAPLPYLSTSVMGASPVAEFGSDAQRSRWLPAVVEGKSILTAALTEEGFRVPPHVPHTTASLEGGRWRINGRKLFVPAATLADAILVPARTHGGVGLFIVPRDAQGVKIEPVRLTSLEPQAHVTFEAAVVEEDALLGDPSAGPAMINWITRRSVAGICALQAGVCSGALALTAKHVSEREQFGSKIGTFQAVAHRAADAWIDTTAIRLTSRQAAWRLAEGLPADEEIAVAKFWAAEGSFRVAHAAQHLHGGLGFDTDYPVHRYFRWAKVLELSLGSSVDHLLSLADAIAAPAPD